ncbi:MAG: hypothetical protein ACODAD_13290, partial [Planctomycetota bacterium]
GDVSEENIAKPEWKAKAARTLVYPSGAAPTPSGTPASSSRSLDSRAVLASDLIHQLGDSDHRRDRDRHGHDQLRHHEAALARHLP